jgi:hypothetical protein
MRQHGQQEQLTAFELERQQRMAENRAKMMEMGVHDARDQLLAVSWQPSLPHAPCSGACSPPRLTACSFCLSAVSGWCIAYWLKYQTSLDVREMPATAGCTACALFGCLPQQTCLTWAVHHLYAEYTDCAQHNKLLQLATTVPVFPLLCAGTLSHDPSCIRLRSKQRQPTNQGRSARTS